MAALVAACGVWIAWPSSQGAAAPVPRARVYSAYSACLLTDDAGISSISARPVWTGMEAASAATSMTVSYLQATGATNVTDVQSYLNTLLVRSCNVLVAVGGQETAAVAATAGSYPSVHFVVVGAKSSGPNVAPVAGANEQAVTAGVRQLLVAANAGRFGGWAAGTP
jgi:basic membrane lipoprotein Med (substrate-binding protein (PBP1-ABC) superfamily)